MLLLAVFILSFWPLFHGHLILHRPAKFRLNRIKLSRWTTSYRFFKMAAMESQIYFLLQLQWRHSFYQFKIYLHAKFQWNISIRGWVITTYGKQTATTFVSILTHSSATHLHRPTKFRPKRIKAGAVMTLYRFLQRVRIARNAERCTS